MCMSIGRPSLAEAGLKLTSKELDDLSVNVELPSLVEVISKDELHRLTKEEKKRQDVINGNFATVFASILIF